MLIENDFEHDDGHQQPDAPASPPPPPLVVIQYRNRGIPLVLVPPVLILAAVLGFQAHRRMTPSRRVVVLPPVLAAVKDRPAEPGTTSAEEEAGRFLARAESPTTLAPDPARTPPPETSAEPATDPARGPFPDVVADRLGPPASAAAIEQRGGFPSPEEIDALLDPYGQTVRGTGIGGPAGG